MALPVGLSAMGTFQGKKGDPGSIAYATGELVPWSAGFDVEMVGPESNRGAHFKVPMSPPSSEFVNNDDATEALVLTPTKTKSALAGSLTAYDVPATAAALANATNVFTTAAASAAAAGRTVLRVAPGTYKVPGLHPDDIAGLYVVGDGVKLTGNPGLPAWVYPFTTDKWARQGRVAANSGGRGRLAIELDDGSPSHWTDVFPETEKLGIPLACPWHTANGERWIKEVYRHGWEIMSHLPANTPSTSVTLSVLEGMAQESLDAIRAITGQERVGFVYPQHVRSAETDRVLSKYYDHGRGQSFLRPYRRDKSYQEWLTSSQELDVMLDAGAPALNSSLISFLEGIAASDSSVVAYFHYSNAALHTNRLEAFKKFVRYAQSLGIEFVTPSQIVGNRGLVNDPYDLKGSQYGLVGQFSRSNVQSYHGGTAFAYTAGATPSSSTLSFLPNIIPARMPGKFAIYRGHVRLKALADIPISGTGVNDGIRLAVRYHGHGLDGGVIQGSLSASAPAFRTGNVIPESDWGRQADRIAIDPACDYVVVGVNIVGIQANTPAFYLDELQFDLVDFVDFLEYTVTLVPNGTANASLGTLITNIPNVGDQQIEVIKPAGFAGTPVVSSTAANSVVVRSPVLADAGEVKVIIRPRKSAYPSLTFASTGA